MVHFLRSRTIGAALEAVWSVLGHFMHIDAFASEIASVEPLTSGADGVGSRRRNHFRNVSSLVEEVAEWRSGEGYRVKMIELAAMPLKEASANIRISSADGGSRVTWSFARRVKYGPLGWLLGQAMMKPAMGKIMDGNLKGLDELVHAAQAA